MIRRGFRYSALVPVSIVNGSDEDDDIDVAFDWCPGTPDDDGDDFNVVDPPLSEEAEDRVVEWLDTNWTRPGDGEGPDPEGEE